MEPSLASVAVLGAAVVCLCVVAYPLPPLLGVWRIVSRAYAAWRRRLVVKYGTQLARGYRRHGIEWLTKQGWSREEGQSLSGKSWDDLVAILGTEFVNQVFGEPDRPR